MTDFGQRRRTLPKTGQTTSYRDGDDGDLEKGWDEAERFKDVGDGTVIDNATGLMWPKDWSGDGGNSGKALDWNAAIDWANALDFAGYSDWRLPNPAELFSLMECKGNAPLIYDIFINVVTGDIYYFTSTTMAEFSNSANVVDFTYQQTYYKYKFFTNHVVAVRDA